MSTPPHRPDLGRVAKDLLQHAALLTLAIMRRGSTYAQATAEAAHRTEDVVLRTNANPETMAALQQLVLGGTKPAVSWAADAFSTIDLGAKLASELAATTTSPAHASTVVHPWNAYRVTVPPGVLSDHGDWILVVAPEQAKGIVTIAVLDDKTIVMSRMQSIADLVRMGDSAWTGLEGLKRGITSPIVSVRGGIERETDAERRALALLHNIVVGTAVELEKRRAETGRNLQPPRGASVVGARGEPRGWTFQLSRPVHVDVREAIREYVRGGGRSPIVRSLIRGHRKRQRFGRGLSELRWITIAPHLRGRGPLAVRPHVVRDARYAVSR